MYDYVWIKLMYDYITRASSRPKCHNLHIFSPKQRCEMNKSRFASPHWNLRTSNLQLKQNVYATLYQYLPNESQTFSYLQYREHTRARQKLFHTRWIKTNDTDWRQIKIFNFLYLIPSDIKVNLNKHGCL